VGKYNAFKPSLLIQNDPFGNPLAFKFTITNNSNLTVLPQAQDTTQLPTPCKCETGCRICNILVINGSFANPSLATYIASVSTE
jgi:ferredoxin